MEHRRFESKHLQWNNVDSSGWYRNMSISKKGYLFMILFLGIGITGIGIISAHSLDNYAGMGQVGIHGVTDGSIHIPGDIIFESSEGNMVTITHNATQDMIVNFLDLNETVVMPDINITSIDLQGSLAATWDEETGELSIKLEQITCGLLQGLKGVDANGNLFCAAI